MGPFTKKFDPRPPGGSPIRLKIKWHPDFCFNVRVTPHPAWDSGDGTLKGKDEIVPPVPFSQRLTVGHARQSS